MAGKAFIGTSGWSYDHWREVFYPKGVSAAKRLQYYCRRFDTVEVNATFYRLPKDSTYEKWRNETPDDFVFALKGSKLITHNKKLKGVKKDVGRFLSGAQILGAKLGPVLFQLPPSFKKNVNRLSSFLKILPEGFRCAIEFRNDAWNDKEVYKELKKHKVAYCIVSAPGLGCNVEVTADFAYIRFHGRTKWYSYLYSREEIKEWAGRIAEMTKDGTDVYAYFNNDFEGYAVRNAADLKKLLAC